MQWGLSCTKSHSNFLINVWIYGLLPKSRIATGKKTDCMNKVLFGCMRFVCFTMADSHTQKFHPRNSLSMTGYSTMKDNFNLLGTCWTNSSWCTCLCPTRPICFSKSHCFGVRWNKLDYVSRQLDKFLSIGKFKLNTFESQWELRN